METEEKQSRGGLALMKRGKGGGKSPDIRRGNMSLDGAWPHLPTRVIALTSSAREHPNRVWRPPEPWSRPGKKLGK